jgi:hypothetical protein
LLTLLSFIDPTSYLGLGSGRDVGQFHIFIALINILSNSGA